MGIKIEFTLKTNFGYHQIVSNYLKATQPPASESLIDAPKEYIKLFLFHLVSVPLSYHIPLKPLL